VENESSVSKYCLSVLLVCCSTQVSFVNEFVMNLHICAVISFYIITIIIIVIIIIISIIIIIIVIIFLFF